MEGDLGGDDSKGYQTKEKWIDVPAWLRRRISAAQGRSASILPTVNLPDAMFYQRMLKVEDGPDGRVVAQIPECDIIASSALWQRPWWGDEWDATVSYSCSQSVHGLSKCVCLASTDVGPQWMAGITWFYGYVLVSRPGTSTEVARWGTNTLYLGEPGYK